MKTVLPWDDTLWLNEAVTQQRRRDVHELLLSFLFSIYLFPLHLGESPFVLAKLFVFFFFIFLVVFFFFFLVISMLVAARRKLCNCSHLLILHLFGEQSRMTASGFSLQHHHSALSHHLCCSHIIFHFAMLIICLFVFFFNLNSLSSLSNNKKSMQKRVYKKIIARS